MPRDKIPENTRAVESESGARAYFEESGVGVGRKKFEDSESGKNF